MQIEIFINWFHVIFLAVWVDDDWSYSFIVPGTIIALGGLVIWLFLVPKPEDVNLSSDITVSSKKYVFIFSSNCLISKPFQDLAFETCFLFTFFENVNKVSCLFTIWVQKIVLRPTFCLLGKPKICKWHLRTARGVNSIAAISRIFRMWGKYLINQYKVCTVWKYSYFSTTQNLSECIKNDHFLKLVVVKVVEMPLFEQKNSGISTLSFLIYIAINYCSLIRMFVKCNV